MGTLKCKLVNHITSTQGGAERGEGDYSHHGMAWHDMGTLKYKLVNHITSTQGGGERGEGDYSHMWAVHSIQGCAAPQSMGFASLSLEQGLQIIISVWNRDNNYYFSPIQTLGLVDFVFCQEEAL